jgi:predicted Zn-dependent peptidase
VHNFSLDHTASESAAEAVEITTLANGLRVATVKRPIHTVMVSVFNRVGSRSETEAENGISHFLEHMAFKGTTSRNTKQISLEVEYLGAAPNAFTSSNMTAYYVMGLPDHIVPALDILSDVLKNSTFPAEELKREQGVVVEEINESNDDIHDIAYEAMVRTAYPNQPLGRPILGPKENVRGFDKAALDAYMDKHYHANNMIVLAVGAVDHAEFLAEVTKRFSDVEGKTVIPSVPSNYVGGETVVQDSRFEQAHLYVGLPAPGNYDANFAAYDLLSDVLGSGMSSPLFQNVREKRGLCYSVSCGMSPQADGSIFLIGGSAAAENVDEFLTVAVGELKKVANGELDDTDLTRAKNQVVRQIVMRSEATRSVGIQAATDMFFNDGNVITMGETVQKYTSLTKDDIIAAAKQLVTGKTTVVVAGNAAPKDYTSLVAAALNG